jgi:two-component system, CitB family, sensor kinase
LCATILDVRRPNPRGWSLARQLVAIQVCIVVLTVGIEAMVGIYHGPEANMPWSQRQLLGLVVLTELALTIGIAGSLMVAGRVRRQTFNLEPAVIARLYQHHHAMLHAVREGLLITDRSGTVVLVNDEARRLLGLPPDAEGKRLDELLTDAELAGWAADDVPVRDELHVAAGRVLLVSRKPAEVDGVPVGLVTTLRDRTELQLTLHELGAVRDLAAALRAQSHEFANRMQALVGLIELGRPDDAVRLGTMEAEAVQRLSDQILDEVGDPSLTALLLAKAAVAGQRGVEIRVRAHNPGTVRLPAEDLLTIVGNLMDNSLDAAQGRPNGRVELELRADVGALQITVRDNGPGIPPEVIDAVFQPGWTTKPSDQPGGRGLGLALARQAAARLGGTISAHNCSDGGASFLVSLPVIAPAEAGTAANATRGDHSPASERELA